MPTMQRTTPKEIWGWYFYSWASEPFVVSGVGTFVPIMLEQMGRLNGVLSDHHDLACLPVGQPPVDGLPPGSGPGVPGARPEACVVPMFGYYVDTSSLALYTFSLSVLLQAITVICISGAADRGPNLRKRLLVGFGLAGGALCSLFLFVSDTRHLWIVCLLAVLSNACFGAVSVTGNAYLPVLVDNFELADSPNEVPSDESTPLQPASDAQTASKSHMLSRISGFCVAFGYLAGFVVQIACVILILKTGSTTFSLKLALFCVGVWWMVFQVPVMMLLRSHPAPDLVHNNGQNGLQRVLGYIGYGWQTIYATSKEASKMKDMAIFLTGWFLVTSTTTTINSVAVLFARVELQMSPASLGVISMLVVISGVAGAIGIPRLVQPMLERWGLVKNQTRTSPIYGIMAVLAVAALIPLYGILGFFFDTIGLNHPWEMYVLSVWYGIALGGAKTMFRSAYSLLVPRGKETTFFSLFSVTEMLSSVLAPLATGLITDHTHNIRYTFYLQICVTALAAVVFRHLDLDRGTREALAI